MAVKTAAELAIEVTAQVKDAQTGFADVGDSASQMSRQVAAAGESAEDTARKLSITADQADDMAGKTGKATGALGALAGGLEAVGLEKYAAGLQAAGIATDFASGAGDALNLVMESSILKNIKAAAVTAVQTTATIAQTAAQWALNAALSANPIALIVIAVAALVAGLVLAYKKSETFRNIVQGAFNAVKNAAENAFNWVRDNWPLILAIITGPIGLAVLAVVKNWDAITEKVRDVKRFIQEKIGELPGILRTIGTRIKDALLAPFEAIADAVQNIIDLVKKIKPPDWVPFVRAAGTGAAASTTSTATDALTYQVLLQLLGVLREMLAAATPRTFVDELALAQVIQGLLDRSARVGGTVTV